ncbi:hypothetical protein BDR26DRAFT_868463 [Obelidium mucronatum]|nr:hypothetical protein BDR26DRAFT_868463 [Obelidium mucronatum]
MEISAPELRASMKALVPDLAIVPRLLTRSVLVIPIPASRMSRVLLAMSGVMRINSSFSESSFEASVRDSYLILSKASEALEISSRKKISLLE